MSILFRRYADEPGITDDYYKVRELLLSRGLSEFSYARWDWMITHGNLDASRLSDILLCEDDGRVVGAALYDCQPGDAYLVALPQYAHIRRELLVHARERLADGENFALVIGDDDRAYQTLAARMGFVATPEREHDAAIFRADCDLSYQLPKGFSVTDMQATWDPYQYGRVLWYGFGHAEQEGAFAPDAEDEASFREQMLRPNVDLRLKIAVVAPDGNFCSYCGMWYDARADYAVVEPVATDPAFRRMGCGRAAVLEGVGRAFDLGARFAVVGSEQSFYYRIGFRPYQSASKWRAAASGKAN